MNDDVIIARATTGATVRIVAEKKVVRIRPINVKFYMVKIDSRQSFFWQRLNGVVLRLRLKNFFSSCPFYCGGMGVYFHHVCFLLDGAFVFLHDRDCHVGEGRTDVGPRYLHGHYKLLHLIYLALLL